MSIISLPGARPASTNVDGTSTNADVASRPRWSLARLLTRAFVMAIAVAVGFVIAFFIGVATGWIEFQIC